MVTRIPRKRARGAVTNMGLAALKFNRNFLLISFLWLPLIAPLEGCYKPVKVKEETFDSNNQIEKPRKEEGESLDSNKQKEGPMIKNNQMKETNLTGEEARQALIDLVNKSNSKLLGSTLKSLEEYPIISVDPKNPNNIEIGKWHCNLFKKTFKIGFGGPQGGRINDGIFEFSKGKWQAKITFVSHITPGHD